MTRKLLAAAVLALIALGPALAQSNAIYSDRLALPHQYLAVREGSMAPGADLIQWTDTGGEEQRWARFVLPSDPVTTTGSIIGTLKTTARLQNVKSGLCATTDGVAGHPLVQLPCDPNNPRQIWTWDNDPPNSGFSHDNRGFRNPASNLWMDVQGASSSRGAEVIGWYSNAGKNQLWATTGTTITVQTCQPSVNDTAIGVNPGIRDAPGYVGSWQYSSGRPASFQDRDNDVHFTTVNGDSVSYTFYGRSISYVSEASDGYGLVDVYIDGNFRQTVDANKGGVHNRGGQTLFVATNMAVGVHTIRLVKRSGAYMLVDAFDVQP